MQARTRRRVTFPSSFVACNALLAHRCEDAEADRRQQYIYMSLRPQQVLNEFQDAEADRRQQ